MIARNNERLYAFLVLFSVHKDKFGRIHIIQSNNEVILSWICEENSIISINGNIIAERDDRIL